MLAGYEIKILNLYVVMKYYVTLNNSLQNPYLIFIFKLELINFCIEPCGGNFVILVQFSMLMEKKERLIKFR